KKARVDKTEKFTQEISVSRPVLWSVETPALYTAVSRVIVNGIETDRQETKFGIRSIKFTKDDGFFLNGKKTPIRGVCLHHDNGYLGTAVHRRAIERQIEIMKSMGCNAIRTSHNPPDPSLLDLCDSMGMLVMDEAFDEWKENKVTYGYGRFYDEWHERDLTDMILRDRNHPSVIIWSIGNEVAEQWAGKPADAEKRAKRLAEITRKLDPTRPLTAACNNVDDAINKGIAKHLDVFGINYSPWAYEREKGKRTLIATETASAVSSRGVYNLVEKEGRVVIDHKAGNYCSSYDDFVTEWATLARVSLKKVGEASWMAGEFVWTGFDYIGEPTPFWWPSVISYFGIVDLCGFPKDRYYLYKSRWTKEPMVHVLPHWNWEQFEGREIPVYVYTNCESVELFLNGQSLGEKAMKDTEKLRLEWKVKYEKGTLLAVGKNSGAEACRAERKTAGRPARLELSADRNVILAGNRDLSYVTARVLDENGNLCPTADNEVEFSIKGDAEIAATGNGDQKSHAFFNEKKCKAFSGILLCIVRAGEKPSDIVLKARAKGMVPAEIVIKSTAGN
ncbi:MAG TPA: glycoside hydrolase family 2 TIM barrel-domain containing protein, partial [Candidatus Goldiibacteriota bacterium]|nr:glycoside hydrolase family 2 TIM barrel-domain containing protein [Candidatus Goldiibacteriota bacterium]